jgi:hypothetical protein
MPIITRSATRAFVKGVKLAAAPRRTRALEDTPPVALKAKEAQTLVVGSGLIVAAENVPVQTREDLINCTLFAQLAASGAVGDPSKVSEWYEVYFRTLTALGWAQSSSEFEEYAFSSMNAEAHKAILKVLAVLLGPQAAALAVVQTALEALQSMNENSPWITLFDRQSKTGKSAHFQVATAQLEKSGLLQIALVAFDLRATSTLTQVLFFKFSSSSTRLKYAAGKASIYDAVLKDQRAAIAARLSAYRAAYVGQVAFPPPPPSPTRALAARRANARRGRR